MKLIDLLVQELPKCGGWPKDVTHIGQDYDRELMFYGKGSAMTGIFLNELAIDHRKLGMSGAKVTREQYVSALAASQKPEWSGEGLPPVGAKVEFFINPKFGYCNDWIPDAGTEMEVVAHKTTTDGNDVAVCYWDEDGAGLSCCLVPESLKPLRTEAERKRNAAIEAIYWFMPECIPDTPNEFYHAKKIYDAIAAGKIPGVKLDD